MVRAVNEPMIPSAAPYAPGAGPELVLGTVQLGLPYGIANVSGQPNRARALEIVAAAWEAGVRCFDTAQAYGGSETVLGASLQALGVAGEARVITKLAMELFDAPLAVIRNRIDRSFARLGSEPLHALLLHEPAWLARWNRGVGELLLAYQTSGRIRHLGISIASPVQISLLDDYPDLSVVQVAANAWDRRLDRLRFWEDSETTLCGVFIRSIFLQGLLLLPPEDVAQRLPAAVYASRMWQTCCRRIGAEPKEVAVRYALALGCPLVIGAEAPMQIRETVQLARLEALAPQQREMIAASLDPLVNDAILEPGRWPAQRRDL